MRRGNTLTIWPNPLTGEPKVPLAAALTQLQRMLKATNNPVLFVATDLKEDHEEMRELRAALPIVRLNDVPRLYSKLSATEAAIVDQIMCIQSVYFMGTFGSTVSQVIWEERGLLGHSSQSTYNAFALEGEKGRDVSRHYAPMPDMLDSLRGARKRVASI